MVFVTVRFVSVPTDVKLDETTLLASVVPVNALAADVDEIADPFTVGVVLKSTTPVARETEYT